MRVEVWHRCPRAAGAGGVGGSSGGQRELLLGGGSASLLDILRKPQVRHAIGIAVARPCRCLLCVLRQGGNTCFKPNMWLVLVPCCLAAGHAVLGAVGAAQQQRAGAGGRRQRQRGRCADCCAPHLTWQPQHRCQQLGGTPTAERGGHGTAAAATARSTAGAAWCRLCWPACRDSSAP